MLLAGIGIMRYAMHRSATAAAATRCLVAAPRRSRYAAINVGCHFISLFFNVGIGRTWSRSFVALLMAGPVALLLASCQ